MDSHDLISILEVVLLAGVFLFLSRFIFINYTSKVRKPQAWTIAVRNKELSPGLLQAEKKYGDRIRFYNIWLQINRILKDNIPGDFAELGVYKGETAKLIHLCAPERKLHLFDTFEGFPAEDLIDETGKAASYTSLHFSDTSLDKVKERIGESKNIQYHKGYFPDSVQEIEGINFAFVSIDADLRKPTLDGLMFFYPRMSKGGAILVHDYNSDWPGLMDAVNVFCKENNITKILVPDADSTVMILKT